MECRKALETLRFFRSAAELNLEFVQLASRYVALTGLRFGALVGLVSGQPSVEDLARQFAMLEERMKTMDERHDKGWIFLRGDMVRRDAESAKRETPMLLAVAGLVSFGVMIPGILIRWPG